MFRFRVLVMCYLRMAVMHLPTKFCANNSFQFEVIDIFQNPSRRPPPSWIFKSCTIGTFRHVNSVVLELYIKFGSNICDSHWDQHTYAHLMTSRELTSGFDFSSGGHLRMAVMHLPIKICCRYMYPVQSYWHFSEIQDGGRRHLGFSVYVNLAIPACWWCGICVLYQVWFKYML